MGILASDIDESLISPVNTKLTLYFWIIIVIGLTCLLAAIYHLPYQKLDGYFLVLFCFTIGIGSRMTLEIPRFKSHIAVSDTFIFLALLLYGGEIAIVLAAIEAFCSSWRFCNKKISVFFNAATMSLSMTIVVGTLKAFGLYGGMQSDGYGESFNNLFILISIMALTQFLTSTSLAAIFGAYTSEKPLWVTWKTNYAWLFITYFVGAISAGALVKATEYVGFGVVVASFPIIFFIYLTYRMYLKNVEMATAHAELAESHAESLEKEYILLRKENEILRESFVLKGNSEDDATFNERSLNRQDLYNFKALLPQLIDLTALHLPNNQLTELPRSIVQLQNLQRLSLNDNQFEHFPNEIIQLSKLTELTLSNNQLSEFPMEITQLSNLRKLYLSHNNLTDLPREITQLKNLTELDLRGNSLPIPDEILEDFTNAQKIINYFLKSRNGGPINEAKIIVIGESSVGKSSLIKRLIFNTFDPNEDKTHGIEIFCWNNVDVNGENVQLNVWDFGGQEIMHATHEFFFSNRTLYILVVNARENQNEQRADYWLTKIRSLSKNSPVIVVGNKLDQAASDTDLHGKFQIDEYALLSKYGDIIKGFFGVCSDTRKNEYDEEFINFRTNFIKAIGSLGGIHTPFPKDWFVIKNQLENMPEDFISYDEFIRRCESRGVTDRLDQETLLEFLHDLGIVLSFQKDRRLQDTQVRNPRWVTKGVYSIVESQQVKDNNGTLTLEMLNDILDKSAYPPHKHLFIIDMMRKFELCYDIIPDKKFLIPGSLPTKQPFIDEWQNTLNFQYKYETYFGSIISRFIVKMHTRVEPHYVWHNGVILKYKDSKALIKSDPQEKTITISITGNKFISRDFLSMIRNKFDEIHEDFSMVIEERIPIPDQAGFYEDYQHLLNLEAMGETTIVPRGLKEKYHVKKLLNNIESEDQRQERYNKRADLRVELALPAYKDSSALSIISDEDKTDSIPRLQNKIKMLEDEHLALEQKKLSCERQATFNTTVYSIPFYAVFTGILVAVIYYALYAQNQLAKTILSAFSIILAVLTVTLSMVKGKEWSPNKFYEQFYEKQKKRMYKNFGFDENVFTAISKELTEARRDLKTLEK